MIPLSFRTLDDVDCKGKRILVRVDLNVPVQNGRISDQTRLTRLVPTIRELSQKGGRVVLISHFSRPKGKIVAEMSLAPIGEALADILGQKIQFVDDCIGPKVKKAVDGLKDGEILLLENTRFHPGEEKNDPIMAKQMAELVDFYVNDAFSAAHRAHASTEGIARYRPSYAGRLMEAELNALTAALDHPDRPVAAIVGGIKISTKLKLLGSLIRKVDCLIIGGAMANTFLLAKGVKIGTSFHEPSMQQTALEILADAERYHCDIILPADVVVANKLEANAHSETVPISHIPDNKMILDIGAETIQMVTAKLQTVKTVVWNGPLGAFETPPFDASTIQVAYTIAGLTRSGKMRSIAGGGDTVSVLRHAGVAKDFSYISTAGGAFLEWLEGKTLPGIMALKNIMNSVAPL